MKKRKQGTRTPVKPIEILKEDVIQEETKPEPRQIILRSERDEVCSRCGSRNMFTQQSGMRFRGTVRVASARCRSCGQIAQIRVVPKVSI